jgi:hypothetical protein
LRRALIVLLSLVAVPLAGQAEGLLGPAQGAARTAEDEIGVVRSRRVRVRLANLPGASSDEATRGRLPETGQRLVLNLFDDTVVQARMTHSERQGGAFVWVGRVEGQPLGDVVLAVVDGVLTGSVVWPGGAYRIRYDGQANVVEQIDHDRFPESSCFRRVPGRSVTTPSPAPAMSDDGSLVDVLVAYTPAARAAAGGTSGMLSLVSLAVAETNTGYGNSGVVQRLRLAGTAELSYTESDIFTDLDRVTGTSDGYMDGIHSLRDTYRADEVVLIGDGYASSGACGVAWLMAGNDPGFAPNAFAVVDRSCATGYFSFGHELGHNMGLNHAREDPVGTGAYAYSYGYKWTGYRTVMAYSPGTRILHFSNPAVSYLGNPTGVVETSPSSAHNALSLNNTRVTVANWRESLTPVIEITAPNGGEMWRAGETRTVTWTGSALPSGSVVRLGYSDGVSATFLATAPASEGSYVWTVPPTPGASWRIKACVSAAPSKITRRMRGTPSPACLASDSSDGTFTINP